MSGYSYQYPENYSTPSTPHAAASPWDVDQNQGDFPAYMASFQSQQEQQQLSQPHTPYETTLPLSGGGHQELAASQEQLQYQHHQHQQQQQQQYQAQPQFVHDSGPILLHPVYHERSDETTSRVVEAPTPLRVDTSGVASQSTLVIRHAPRSHASLDNPSHPYRRPQPNESGGVKTRSASAAVRGSLAEPQPLLLQEPPQAPPMQQLRFVPQRPFSSSAISRVPSNASSSSARAGSSKARKASPETRAAKKSKRVPPPQASSSSSTTVIALASSSSAAANASSPRVQSSTAPSRRFLIRTDVCYDAGNGVLTAMLELPGVKKSEVNIKLSTNAHNRVRQVVVSGKSTSFFDSESERNPALAFVVRERKFGDFFRTFAVPSETKMEDVQAVMENGVLTLRISCAAAATGELEPPQDIPVL